MRSILIDGLSRPVRLQDFELVEAARNGEVGMGGFDVDSENAAFYFNAHKTVSVHDYAAGSNIYTGFVADKDLSRGPFSVQNDRQFETGLVDLNTMLIDDIMTGADANRPAETDIERVTWLVGTSFLNGMGANIGGTNAIDLEAADYRTQQPLSLLTQAAETSGKLFFVYWDLAANGPKLFYDIAPAANFTTPHKISTYLPDGSNSTTHHPVKDSLSRRMDGGRIYSELLYKYDGGSVTVTNTATASNFKPRKTVVYDNTVKTSAMATRKANRYLANAATEEETIMVSVLVEDEDANAFRAGQLMQIKAPHLGLPNFTDRRIVRTSKKPRTDTDEEGYRIDMELSLPTFSRWGSRGTPLDQLPDEVTEPSTPSEPAVVEIGACVTLGPRGTLNRHADGTQSLSGGPVWIDVGSWVSDNTAWAIAGCPIGGGGWSGWYDRESWFAFTAPADDPSYLGLMVTVDASGATRSGFVGGYTVRFYPGPAAEGLFGEATAVAGTILGTTATVYVPRSLIAWGDVNSLVLHPEWECARSFFTCNEIASFSFPYADGRGGSGYYAGIAPTTACTVAFALGTTGPTSEGVAAYGAVDGVNRTFTLIGWDGTGTPTLSVNGLDQSQLDATLNRTTGSVTLASPPPANAILLWTYMVGALAADITLTPDPVAIILLVPEPVLPQPIVLLPEAVGIGVSATDPTVTV